MASIRFSSHSSSSLSLHQCGHNSLCFPLSSHDSAITMHPILKCTLNGLCSGFIGLKCSPSQQGGLFSQRKSGVFVRASSMPEHSSNKGKPDFQHHKSTRGMQEKSNIVVIGLSVHTAPVEMREKLAIPEAEWAHAIADLCNLSHIEEAAVLSTCNRMEIYVVALSYHLGVQEVIQWMSKASGIPLHELQENLFILRERDMINHLFRVAAGLDSLVLGEGQILAQVKHVCKVGQAEKGFGRTLASLFKEAVTAGKRVRTETSIAVGAVSISSAAVELAAARFPHLGFAGARVLVVGAGKMGKLVVKHLIAKGCSKMMVVNRSEHKVLDLRAEFPEADLQYCPFSDLMRCTSEADVVFTSTAAESPLYDEESVRSLPFAGAAVGGVRLFVDIAVPRNVPASVGGLTTARLYNVDDLKEVVSANKEERRKKGLEAGTIIEEHITSFNSWRESLETIPTIKKLRAYAERIRMAELEKCLGKMGADVPTKRKKLVEELSRGIVNKLLHGPLTHLRCEGKEGKSIDETLSNMQAVERMFDLQHETISVEGKLSTKVEQVQVQVQVEQVQVQVQQH